MALLKISTAYTATFLMVDSTDHISAKTGLTVTVNISKAGAAFGAAGGTVSEIANGWYKCVLTTTDTNTLGDLSYHCTATGADATDFKDQVWNRTIDDLAFPATSGRSVLVNTDGSVAPDWANIKSPTTTVALTGTTVGTATAVTNAVVLAAKDSFVVRNNTAAAGAGSTITLDAGASAVDNFYNGTQVKIDSATGAGQSRTIIGYVGSTQVATVDRAWATNPDNTSVFTIVAADQPKTDSSLQVVAASVQGNVTGSVASVTGSVGSVTGAVGSVTGAVGSVTGNVGGNVVGSVGSLTTNNDKTGYSIAVSGIGATSISAAGLNAIADAHLDRNMSTGADSGTDLTVRTPRQALRVLRNKVSISAGTQTVTKEDDTTTDHTKTIATTAGNPISSQTPA